MPKVVDHDARRAELATAVWELIRREGLSGVTVRKVADASGWSVGAVRHYLPTQADIVDVAARRVVDVATARLLAVPAGKDLREDARALVHAMMPLDAESTALLQVWLAFVGDAAAKGEGAPGVVHADLSQVLEGLLVDMVAAGLVAGDPAALAVELQALVDGLSVHLLVGAISADSAVAAIDAWLDRVSP